MNKIYVLMATIPQREIKLKEIIQPLYDKVDEIRIVFNNYKLIPNWIYDFKKIKPLLNTPDNYTSSAVWFMMEDVDGYVFICDDDISYPVDYIDTMVKKMGQYQNKVIMSLYGEVAPRPFRDYCVGRCGYMFTFGAERDIPVDICGGGCAVFHTDFMRPTLADFPDIYSRDLWLSIFAAKKGLPLVRPQSSDHWLKHCDSPNSPEIRNIWRFDPKLTARRQEVFTNILVPLLGKDKPKEYVNE